ncbi:Uncharacterised protein [Mycobacteroides abscessus subsp. abscessus]|uniref:hypothetical protein n=1 Tax=Mycobacteroides abscessus TaxID=36809 RepID=UPI00092CB13D|nr:hypothetical protein [Mycobacteroides abscessus]SHU70083.1 Uncharacterised protein [Mycobacteroides abscessus subsp. abscessus]
MTDLYVANNAAKRVADEIRIAIDQLTVLRRDAIAGFQADLGMGNCEEGRAWNRILNTVISSGEEGSLLAAIDGLLSELKERAEWAEQAQREFDTTEHRSADSYRKLVNSADVYPQI